MGGIKITLHKRTLNSLNSILNEFEKNRNLGGILRIIAIKSVSQGMAIKVTAELIRTSEETIRNWISDFLARGIKSLFSARSPGRPPILSNRERQILKRTVANPPGKAGFSGGCWDAKKVRKFLLQEFGKKLSVKYIPELLKGLGLSFKKARIDCGQKNAFLREQWVEQIWPKIVETADKQDAHILFGDEAFFSIFGTTGYTWMLKNSEVVIESTGTHGSLKVIGAINFSTAKLHALVSEDRVDEDIVVSFLKTLLRENRKPIHLILDNAKFHKSEKVKEFIEEHKTRLTVHYLPAYSPDFNPIEGLWKKIKKATTHNVYFETVEHLWDALVEELKKYRDQPSEIRSLFGFYADWA
jgi:transposase